MIDPATLGTLQQAYRGCPMFRQQAGVQWHSGAALPEAPGPHDARYPAAAAGRGPAVRRLLLHPRRPQQVRQGPQLWGPVATSIDARQAENGGSARAACRHGGWQRTCAHSACAVCAAGRPTPSGSPVKRCAQLQGLPPAMLREFVCAAQACILSVPQGVPPCN